MKTVQLEVEKLEHVDLGEVESDEQVTLGGLIRSFDDEKIDTDALVEKLIDIILAATPEQARAYLRTALAAQVHTVHRIAAQAVEEMVDDEIRVGVDPSAARKKLVSECFFIPSVGLVRWLEATAEQHLERAAYQRSRAVVVIKDAERHERAAKDIIEAGVTCLAEIPAGKVK
jgi:hypothetical protein